LYLASVLTEMRVPKPFVPNPAEEIVLTQISADAWASFDPGSPQPPTLRASFLRRLWMGLPAPPGYGGTDWPQAPSPLRIRGARIQGKLELSDAARVTGTALPPLLFESCEFPDPIELSHARLARLSLQNSRITHLCAHGMRVDGSFQFPGVEAMPAGDQLHAIAWIDARGSSIGGEIDGRRARLRAPPPRPKDKIAPGFQQYALRLSNCEVRGRINLMEGFCAFGGVSLADSDIRGEVWLRGATVSAGEGDAFRAQSTRFGALVALDEGFTAEGEVSLMGAKIAGPLQMTNAVLKAASAGDSHRALIGEQSQIGGAVRLNGIQVTGFITFENATIAGNFECSNALIDSKEDALRIFNAVIGTDMLLRNSTVIGLINMSGAQIGRDLWIHEAKLIEPLGARRALSAPNLRVSGSLNLDSVLVLGTLWLEHIEVSRLLNCTALTFADRIEVDDRCYNPDLSEPIQFVLSHAHIGSTLKFNKLTSTVDKLTIDLGGARVVTLDDRWPEGWGDEAARSGRVELDLDGFTYERIEALQQSGSEKQKDDQATLPTNWLRMRLQWLDLQKGQFVHQPYRHLAKVLRAQGHDVEARTVLIEELWKAPTTRLNSLPRFLFGLGFGFGLAPLRAFLSLLTFVVLGWIIIVAAQCGGAMVLSVAPITSVDASTLPNALPARQPHAAIEPPCGDRIIPLFYSIDLMLPVIPLHQETKCDISTNPQFVGWQIMKFVFSIFGKIVTTLALITFSGVLKPRSLE
jgi:hypothetical protein